MKIGFFDSGIGGLTVLRDAIAALPHEDYVYFADTENVPYGIKPRETVVGLVRQAVDYLADMDIKILVVACNTATSIAIHELRKTYNFPIIGMEPAVKPAIVNRNGSKRVLVTATTLTLYQEKLENLLARIDTDNSVDKLPLDGLVPLAENFNFDGPEAEQYLQNQLLQYDFSQYSSIVLGCTHFIYYQDLISRIIGNTDVSIIDGNAGTVNHMIDILQNKQMLKNGIEPGTVTYINSCHPETDAARIQSMNRIIGR